jgi:glycosyltransferase involved in cell wall biosynthesis
MSSEPTTTPIRLSDGRKPFVVIDGFNLSLERGTGVATYARNLSFALRNIGCEVGVLYGGAFGRNDDALLKEVSFFDQQVEYVGRLQRMWRSGRAIFRSPRNQAFEVPITGSVITDGFRSRLPHYDSIWNANQLFVKSSAQHEAFGIHGRVRLPRRPDIVHWTYPLPLRVPGACNIYTLHDLVPLRLPYTTLDRKRSYLRLMRWIAKTADHIVTVSEASRNDIIELLKVPPQRVTNTYQSVDFPAQLLTEDESTLAARLDGMFGLRHRGYFLFFGSIEPKKNIGRMIEAYLSSDVVTPLVIVGARAWKSDAELQLLGGRAPTDVDRLLRSAQRRIVQLEYASFSGLVGLIRGAKAVVFPSLYEGFGLPVLEAMMLHTPVLSSTTGSIPEVAGDAALLVNPYDTAAICKGFQLLDEDDSVRLRLVQAGKKRVSCFSRENYERALSQLYVEILGNGRPRAVSVAQPS